MLLIAEWIIVYAVNSDIEIWRMVMVGIAPLTLEILKNELLRIRWPKRWTGTLIYDLAVEMFRFVLIIVVLLLLTSFLDQKKALYALLFCSNFLMILAVNALTRFKRK